MLIILTGESGTGKSSIQEQLNSKYNVRPIVTYTTRKQRENEVDGIDYHFVSLGDFGEMCDQGKFIEVAEYSNNRWYASAKEDVIDAIQDDTYWSSIVLTPPGLRKITTISDFGLLSKNVFRVHVQATLNVRVTRYIARCGDNFDFAEFAEIYERVQRDFGMFLNIDEECDYVLYNNGDFTLNQMAKAVLQAAKDHKEGNLEYMIATGRIKGTPKKIGPNR